VYNRHLVDAQQIPRRNVVDIRPTCVHVKSTRNVNTNAQMHIPAYPAIFPSLLMQNDTVQHLLKSYFVLY